MKDRSTSSREKGQLSLHALLRVLQLGDADGPDRDVEQALLVFDRFRRIRPAGVLGTD